MAEADEAPNGLADSTHVRPCLPDVEEDLEGLFVVRVVDGDVRHAQWSVCRVSHPPAGVSDVGASSGMG